MIYETTIIALTVIALIGIAIAIIVRINAPKRKLYKYLRSNCMLQAAVLLDKDEIFASYSFTQEEKLVIEKMSLEDWMHWHSQVEMAKAIANKYPLAFNDLLMELFPQVYRRKCVVKRQSNRRLNKNEVLVEGLLTNELSLVIAESEESWNNRISNNGKASRIKISNKDGFETYCEIKKRSCPTTIEILRDSNEIVELQKAYNQSLIYNEWEKRQEDFCDKYYALCKEHRNSDGRFTYNVKFTHNDKYFRRIESEFKVWQGFVGAYSYESEELQPSHMISTRNKLPEWKSYERYYYNQVYDGIFQVAEGLASMQESKPLIVFVFSSRYEWNQDTYNKHYRYIRNLLESNGYDTVNMELLSKISKEAEYESVMIIDLITHNDDLKLNCKLIAEYFTKKQPNIAYYSLLKEYSKNEVERFYKKKSEEKKKVIAQPAPITPPLKKNEDIEFIKEQFKRVNKHSFFSYIAITNTLIGKARHAEDVKKIWLDIPGKYHIETDCSATQIETQYSTDGKNTYTEYRIDGNSFSLDDVAEYTYNLFKAMGVLSQFRSKGSKAIDFINRLECLKHH